jgi:hypothetical protein
MTTITIPAAGQLAELRAKLANLIDEVDERLNDEYTDRQYLLENLLDRLSELATGIMPAPATLGHAPAAIWCGLCGHFAATARVTAGIPGTSNHRNTPVCSHCTLPAITAAAPAGPVSVHPIARGANQ